VPDPFVLALILTVIVIIVGLIKVSTADAAPEGGAFWTVMGGWADGVKNPNLLAFALKMCLILVTGHALALSPIVQDFIAAIARVPRTAAAATVMVALVACISGIVHWGLGAITGALLAREIGRHAEARGLKIHYPLLGAAAYAGLAVWHGGLSGSAPLTVAAEGHFTAELIGVVPMSDTVFSSLNLIISGALIAVICAVFWALTPKDQSEFISPDPSQLAPLPSREAQPVDSTVHWLQESWTCGAAIGTAGLMFVAWSFATDHMKLDLDSIILVFLFLGIALQGSLRHFVEAIADGAKGAGAIILQFPFYFGILGVMKASGIVAAISDFMVDISSQATLPIATFVSAGLVNLFVPSGGGQWAVQGDILLTAGNESGVDPATMIMAFSYGDAWTNMLQPFWALPLLGIMGLRARDIIGYTAVVFLAMAVVVPALLLAIG
jgi:short-chain fatty acids transporter